MKRTVVIVGGGLSGLSCTQEIQRQNQDARIIIVESRNRIGGRMHGGSGVDLGAAWTWGSDNALRKLTDSIGVKREPQHFAGMALLHSESTVEPYGANQSPSGPSERFKGGSEEIINKLHAAVEVNTETMLNTSVRKISQSGEQLQVMITEQGSEAYRTIIADAVVVAIPPRDVAYGISFSPDISNERRVAMASTPTWMDNTGKVALVYDEPFWHHHVVGGMPCSGTVFSESGPLRQIWDNSTSDGSLFVLAGFVFDEDLISLSDEASVRAAVLPQITSIFGAKASRPIKVLFKSWRCSYNFSIPSSVTEGITLPTVPSGLSDNIKYGDVSSRTKHGRIVFAGTESMPNEHGHMNGAVLAGHRAAAEVLSILK